MKVTKPTPFSTIPLTRGLEAQVSVEDYEYLSQFKWIAHKRKTRLGKEYFYATRSDYTSGKQKHVSMHRVICPGHHIVDHRDGDTLNNQRSNLRGATVSQNIQNSTIRKNKKSKYKGVSWHKNRARWVSRIQIGLKRVGLGYFTNEKDAANAYDNAAKANFGQFARTNRMCNESY